jgi:hypothetical protein
MRMRASNSDINRSKPWGLEGSLARKLAPEWMIRVQSTRSPRRISPLNPPALRFASAKPDAANAVPIRTIGYTALVDYSLSGDDPKKYVPTLPGSSTQLVVPKAG